MDGYDDKIPPSDKTIEDAIIGSMLFSPESAAVGLNTCNIEDFYHPQNRVVVSTMYGIVRAGGECDLTALVSELFKLKLNERAGGVSRLGELQFSVGGDRRIPEYAAKLRELTLYRRIINEGRATLHKAYAAQDPPTEIIANSIQNSIAHIEAHGKLKGDKLSFDKDLTLIDTWQKGEGRPALVPFGFGSLDSIVQGGMMPGEMTVVAARTGVGKTSFGSQIALQAAKHGRKIAIFSLEMSAQQIRHRMLSQVSGIPEHLFARKGAVNAQDWEKLKRIAKGIMDRDIWITDEPYLTTSQIRLRIQQAFTKQPPDLILVDHLTKIKPHDQRASLYEKSGLIASDLKNIAKEFGCVVLALSQFGRQADKQDRPRLSDIRESGKIEEEAATVVAIHRKSCDTGGMEDIGEFVVLKSRYSGLGIAHFKFLGHTFRFFERSFEVERPEKVDLEQIKMGVE